MGCYNTTFRMKGVIFILILLQIFFWNFDSALGQEIGDIMSQIHTTHNKIEVIEKEIAKFEKELVKTEKEKNDLNKAIKTLDLSKKKLGAENTLTARKIESTNLSIIALESNIYIHNKNIEKRLSSIANTIRNLNILADDTLVEVVLGSSTMADSLDRVYNLERTHSLIKNNLEALETSKEILVSDKTNLETEYTKLKLLQSKLLDQQRLVLENQAEKKSLLFKTKNKETEYKSLLEKNIIEKEKFERELRAYEIKLKAVNLNNLPQPGSGILSWPLNDIYVTQYFGNTEFAKQNTQLYNGKGHNGIDLRASLGTTVKVAADARVAGIGNTDLGCPGGSYGKWVLVTHNNGLSSLYAHLSLVKVTIDDNLKRGDLVGYSGSTGYSTGPHLHFTVYATEGVKVSELFRSDGTKSKCGEMPVSPLNGYLNPLVYL
ncbi:MAG TPA: peptidoglycan DD-metalloendopeptidase family protein [Candidatus Paceibacterota bacterium]